MKTRKLSLFSCSSILLISAVVFSDCKSNSIALAYGEMEKAMQSEAKSYIGAITRAQQAYRLENPSFASTFTDLKIGLPTRTENYIYKITSASKNSTTIEAISLKPKKLRSYAGKVITDKGGGTKAMACQTTEPSNKPPIPDPATLTCKTGEPMN